MKPVPWNGLSLNQMERVTDPAVLVKAVGRPLYSRDSTTGHRYINVVPAWTVEQWTNFLHKFGTVEWYLRRSVESIIDQQKQKDRA